VCADADAGTQVLSRLQQTGGGSSRSLEGLNASAAVGESAGADARRSGAAGGSEEGIGEESGGGGGGDTGEADGLDADEPGHGDTDEAVSGIAGRARFVGRAARGALTRAVAEAQADETEWASGSEMDDDLREALRVSLQPCFVRRSQDDLREALRAPPAAAAGHRECYRAGPRAGSRPQRSVAHLAVTAGDGARNGR
jgi:hypothetical protein